jgi:polysaccharide deacetylase family protein (PEP-CTERM system associated)
LKPAAIFTVDVEDWYHAAVINRNLQKTPSHSPEKRLLYNLQYLAVWLNRWQAKATFFCLADWPKEINDLLKQLSDNGNEIASHGVSHTSLQHLSGQQILTELKESKDKLEQITGKTVEGFRAPNFSITDQAIDLLQEAGYRYDSSVFNVKWHPSYGRLKNHPIKATPYAFTNGLMEMPLSTFGSDAFSIPVAGGAYFRHLPFSLYKRMAFSLAASGYFHFYIHPWEVDLEHPFPPSIGYLDKIRHYRNLDKVPGRLDQLAEQLQFESIATFLSHRKH